MFYLVSQMALFLVLAAIAGVGVGWWLYYLRYQPQFVDGNESASPGSREQQQDRQREDDIFAIKRRLDQCFDENAKLRRDLKSAQKASVHAGNGSDTTTDAALQDKFKVLLEDLQLRDDTILALEKELERMRNSS